MKFLASFLLCFFCAYNALASYKVYLTFDDGPLQPGTEHINDVVLAKKVNVSVFLVGSELVASPSLKEFRLEGVNAYKKNPFIRVCNHSFSHAYDKYRLFYENPQNVYKDILYNQKFLGIKYKIVRLPGRNSWGIGNRMLNDVLTRDTAESVELLVNDAGFSVIGWDVEWKKIKGVLVDPNIVYRDIKRAMANQEVFTHGHLVVLCHDQNFLSMEEKSKLSALIDMLQKDPDISLDFITNYPGVMANGK